MASSPMGHVTAFLLFVVIASHQSLSQTSLPSQIGFIPWGSITKDTVQKMVNDSSGDLDPLTVVTVVLDTAETSYSRIENMYAELKKQNLVALMGRYHRSAALAAAALHIPYFTVTDGATEARDHTLELSPDMDEVGMAVYEVANHYDWSKISVFYDDDRGVTLMEKLMTNHTMTVRGWRLSPDAESRMVKMCLVEMRKVLVEQSVVLCNKHNTQKILDQARGLAMLSTPPYQWIFYDPGHELQNLLLAFHDIAVNFTVLSLLPLHTTPSPQRDISHLNYALLSDAVTLLTSVYSEVRNRSDVTYTEKSFKEELNHAIRQTKTRYGVTDLTFDKQGDRGNFTMYITGFPGNNETVAMGRWFSRVELFDSRLQMNGGANNLNRSTPFPLKGRTAKVVMIQEPPFTMLKRDYIMRKGNDRFSGFAVDLIAEVAAMLEFDYEIYLVHDGNFGSKQSNGEWNGMIGELLAGNATMSVAPLSINSDREEAVDFTKPFMTRYINVLMRVPRRETSYFEFLNPLSPIVWICTLCAFVFVSIVLYALERIGSSSRTGSSKSQKSPGITMREAFWFIFGSLLQGNTDSSPTTIPGRILTSAWWFFALILISSYTANLAAFLTVKKINTPIKSVTDLAQQTKIKYGTVKSSGVMGFFKNTKIEHFAKMWAHMSEIDPESMVDNTSIGFSKVKLQDYAFFWDTTVNKYQTIIDCDFMEIGPPFDPKGFGIGVPPGATYREELSMAILRLSDRGKLHELETKYWGSRNCPDLSKPSSDETSELQIENVAGVFFILVGGIVIAAVVCLGEYVGHALLRASKLETGTDANSKAPSNEAFL